MKKGSILIVIIFFITILYIYPKGNFGTYIITGKIYLNKKGDAVFANQQYEANGKTYKTDQDGTYKIEVEWTSDCPFGLNSMERKKFKLSKNPKFIIFNINNEFYKIKNKWVRYGLKQIELPVKKEYKFNIYLKPQ